MNRRTLFLGAAAVSTASALNMNSAKSDTYYVPDLSPPIGPWHTSGQIQRAGGILNYQIAGPENSVEPPIILLHRLGGWIADWRHVAKILSKKRKIIAFDLPGHGGSTWQGPVPYSVSLAETAAILVGAMDEMEIDKIDLIGTSLGGCISVILAAFWPERVNSLSVVSSALSPKRSIKEAKALVEDRQSHLFNEQGYPIKYDENNLTKIFGITDTKDIYHESLVSRKIAGLWIQPSERGVVTSDIVGTLSRVKAPTLIVYAEEDRAYGKHKIAAKAALPTASFKQISTGAFAMQEDPISLAAMLGEFLSAS